MEQLTIYCPLCRGIATELATQAGVFGYECRKCDYGFEFIGSPYDCGKTTKKKHDVNKDKGTIYCPLCQGECDKGGYDDDPLRWHCKDDECRCQFKYIPNPDEIHAK